MPAISYSKQNIQQHDFKNKILDGRKKHTIRRYGPGLTKRPFKIGDTLYHYENWRTPQVNKFHENTCLYVADIEIKNERCNLAESHRIIRNWGFFDVFINEKEISNIYELAINDGFPDIENFQIFFIKSGLPFRGQIIGWVKKINYGG